MFYIDKGIEMYCMLLMCGFVLVVCMLCVGFVVVVELMFIIIGICYVQVFDLLVLLYLSVEVMVSVINVISCGDFIVKMDNLILFKVLLEFWWGMEVWVEVEVVVLQEWYLVILYLEIWNGVCVVCV